MFRITILELNKYFKSPILIVYLLFPIFPFILILLAINAPVALTFTIFIQTLLVSLFIYGSRLKNYRNETMMKKINNSQMKYSSSTLSLLLVSIIILSLSLFIPFVTTMFISDSLSHFTKHQFLIDIDGKGVGNIKEALNRGLYKDLLLFNSNFSQFMQFAFAITIVVGSLFSISHLISISIKSDSIYFSFSLLIFLFAILLSSLVTKDTYILYSGEYTRNVPKIGNKTFLLLKYINPFYWINQLLMNSMIANENSGYVASKSEIPIPPGIPADGTFVPSYFNIFHIGTSIGDHIYFKTIFLKNIEIYQILSLLVPIFCLATPIIYSNIKGVN